MCVSTIPGETGSRDTIDTCFEMGFCHGLFERSEDRETAIKDSPNLMET